MDSVGGWRLLVHPGSMKELKPLYDLLNLRFYLHEREEAGTKITGLSLTSNADLAVFESKEAWPRAFFTNHWTRSQSAQELARMIAHGDGRPFAAVSEEVIAPKGIEFPSRVTTGARDYRLTNNTTEFTVKATGPGMAVLTENFEKENFRVTVNGNPASYLRVNHAFKGVLLPEAGEYRIRFTYWPRLLTASLWIAAMGAALCAATAGIVARRAQPLNS
jgi:hypothetical protein